MVPLCMRVSKTCESGCLLTANYYFVVFAPRHCVPWVQTYISTLSVHFNEILVLLPTAFVKIEKRPKFKWNTICVDWEELGSPNTTLITSTGSTVNTVHKLLYFPAIVLSAKITGKRIADFLIFLMKQKALKSYDDVHLIGISLGAHVAGTAGYWIKKKTGKMLGRITGLDPSGNLISYNSAKLFFRKRVPRQDWHKEIFEYLKSMLLKI